MSNKILKESKEDNTEMIGPGFRKHSELSIDQQTDPDYRIKQLEKINGDKLSITCSRCHHCR